MSHLARRGETSRKSLSSFGAEETDEALIAIAEDVGLVPKTSIRYSSRTARNSSCEKYELLFLTSVVLARTWCIEFMQNMHKDDEQITLNHCVGSSPDVDGVCSWVLHSPEKPVQ